MAKVEFTANIDTDPDVENGYLLTVAETRTPYASEKNQTGVLTILQTPFENAESVLKYIKKQATEYKKLLNASLVEYIGGAAVGVSGTLGGIFMNEPLLSATSFAVGVAGISRAGYNFISRHSELHSRVLALNTERNRTYHPETIIPAYFKQPEPGSIDDQLDQAINNLDSDSQPEVEQMPAPEQVQLNPAIQS